MLVPGCLGKLFDTENSLSKGMLVVQVWYKRIEAKLGVSRFIPWTFVSCEGPMQVHPTPYPPPTPPLPNKPKQVAAEVWVGVWVCVGGGGGISETTVLSSLFQFHLFPWQ